MYVILSMRYIHKTAATFCRGGFRISLPCLCKECHDTLFVEYSPFIFTWVFCLCASNDFVQEFHLFSTGTMIRNETKCVTRDECCMYMCMRFKGFERIYFILHHFFWHDRKIRGNFCDSRPRNNFLLTSYFERVWECFFFRTSA